MTNGPISRHPGTNGAPGQAGMQHGWSRATQERWSLVCAMGRARLWWMRPGSVRSGGTPPMHVSRRTTRATLALSSLLGLSGGIRLDPRLGTTCLQLRGTGANAWQLKHRRTNSETWAPPATWPTPPAGSYNGRGSSSNTSAAARFITGSATWGGNITSTPRAALRTVRPTNWIAADPVAADSEMRSGPHSR